MKNIFRRNKATELTNEEKVNESRARVESALSMFTQIHADLQEANSTLETVVAQNNEQVALISQNTDSANTELEANKKLQEKIKQFIKGDSD